MQIIGRVTADAKINELKDGRKVINFSIAVNGSYVGKDSKTPVKVVTYFNCSYWISMGIAPYLVKGALVELYGRAGVNPYNDMEGNAKASLIFHVNNIKLHGKPLAAATVKQQQPIEEGIADDLPF